MYCDCMCSIVSMNSVVFKMIGDLFRHYYEYCTYCIIQQDTMTSYTPKCTNTHTHTHQNMSPTHMNQRIQLSRITNYSTCGVGMFDSHVYSHSLWISMESTQEMATC